MSIDRFTKDDIQGLLNSIDHPVVEKLQVMIDEINALTVGDGGGVNVIYADSNRTDPYVPDGSMAAPYKVLQDAVDAITTQSATNKYVVKAAPGVYPENVVLKRFVYLIGTAMFGAARDVRIEPAAGIALSVPYRDSFINGIYCQTDSPVPAEAAIKIFDDGGGAGEHETFLFNFAARSTDAGHALWSDTNALGEAAIGIYAAIDGGPAGHAGLVDGSGFIWFLGGGGGQFQGIRIVNGGFFMSGGEVGINANETDPTAWAIENDGGFCVLLGNMVSGYNGIDMKNGGFGVLTTATSIGGFTGIPVRTTPGTSLLLGNVGLDGGLPSWTNWQVAGNVAIMSSATQGAGTTGAGGPDQRPTVTSTSLPMGFRFFATDIALGAGMGVWLTWNGTQWVDTVGTVVP